MVDVQPWNSMQQIWVAIEICTRFAIFRRTANKMQSFDWDV